MCSGVVFSSSVIDLAKDVMRMFCIGGAPRAVRRWSELVFSNEVKVV